VTLVIDASVTVRLVANRPEDAALREQIAATRSLHAPELIDAEVASGIRGLLLGGKVSPTRAAEMVEDFTRLRIDRYPVAPVMHRVLALRDNLTAYDACYVVLAEALVLPLFTLDAKLAGAAGHQAVVHVYAPPEASN
jgi:predicted nucleic acid-binding protein